MGKCDICGGETNRYIAALGFGGNKAYLCWKCEPNIIKTQVWELLE